MNKTMVLVGVFLLRVLRHCREEGSPSLDPRMFRSADFTRRNEELRQGITSTIKFVESKLKI